ncbi:MULTISPECIES: hypothetical protein [Dickeya]|uniref:Uncharacterized protein n=2 Tax=Dickeya TaxID=204037 RepID=A0ABX8VYM7_9GAMM|nr:MULTISPECIES: hypothetical protein [Dickeya]QYM90981.1 hypothetical protein FGI21_03420 [Dickeya zeae]QYM90992.1 hypothetical protein FGI21_03475 [Dickeya zeae]WKV51044.1 hypothetical protein PL145_01850 [Dickeya fangzhongdai]
MKHKIRRRNQRWLSEQYRYAVLNDLPMSFFTHISTQRAEMNNAMRLKRRGKLLPCWERATFFPGSVSLPFISSRGKIYYYQTFFEKADVPENYQAHWLEPVDDEDD